MMAMYGVSAVASVTWPMTGKSTEATTLFPPLLYQFLITEQHFFLTLEHETVGRFVHPRDGVRHDRLMDKI